MTAAYGAFANHGIVTTPTLIRRVEDRDGVLLYQSHESATRAISDTTAFLMSTMLADVINSGTGAGARRLGFTLPAAGKTGTTNDFNDAWFIGYTPKLVTGVWVGFDQPRTILPNGFAAEIAVPVWAKFMKVATRNDKPEWLQVPPGVVAVKIDRLSGLLASEACGGVVDPVTGEIDRRSAVYTEYFARGTEPTAYCEAPQTEGVRVAGLLGDEEKPASPRVEENAFVPAPSGVTERRIAPPAPRVPAERAISPAPARAPAEYAIAPPAPTGTSGKVQEIENPATNTTTTKKRRFWQKIFGTTIEEKPYEPEPPPPPPKKKSGA